MKFLYLLILMGCWAQQPVTGAHAATAPAAALGRWPVLASVAPVLDTAAELASLSRATAAIRDAFARGDVDAIVALHHPDIVKYFGGKNVVVGREALRKGLIDMFRNTRMEFIGNEVENTVFTGDVAIQTSIFTIRSTPKKGGQPTVGKGRAMVIYVKDSRSPTGWLSLREMAQEAP